MAQTAIISTWNLSLHCLRSLGSIVRMQGRGKVWKTRVGMYKCGWHKLSSLVRIVLTYLPKSEDAMAPWHLRLRQAWNAASQQQREGWGTPTQQYRSRYYWQKPLTWKSFFLASTRVIYKRVLTTRPLENREFQFVYLHSLLGNTQFIT